MKTAEQIIAEAWCKMNGEKPGFWHPHAQERWRDFENEAKRCTRNLRRLGFIAKAKGPTK